jgi:hypothetical protein
LSYINEREGNMGWTGMYRPKGLSNKEFFGRELGIEGRILDCATIGGVSYAAVDGAPKYPKYALVILMHWSPRDYFNFRYKDMDESMGPCEHRCPTRILDLLDEPVSEYAKEWRERCREYAKRQGERIKLDTDRLVRFTNPVAFADGTTHKFFRVVNARRNQFRATSNGRLYRIPRRMHASLVAHVGP